MKTKLLLLSLSTVMAIPLFSCSKKSEEVDGWNITENDYQNILKFENQVTTEDGKYKFTIDDEFGSFNGNVNKDDVILFNISKLKENKGTKYYTYKDYKNSEVEKTNFEVLEAGHGFTIEFNGNPDSRYGVLINKSITIDNEFAISGMKKSISETKRFGAEDGEWVDSYIESSASVDPNNVLNIECYIGNIIFGALTDNPIAIINGGFGLLGMIAGAAKPAEPSIQDVLNKLEDMDKKLDEINAEIQKNQKQLINEMVYEQAQIDKVLATLYQQDFTAFVTDYVDPIDTFERKYSQYIEDCLKTMVKAEPDYVELHYKRNEKNKLVLISQCEAAYDDEYNLVVRIKMDGYPNAKQFLKDHSDIVLDGFTAALDEDIKATISNHYGNELPKEEISEERYLNDINAAITDGFEKTRYTGEYGTDQYNKASDMLQKAILLCKRISGVSTGESILNSVIQRVKYIYNFGSETKEKVRNIIGNIKMQMERFVAMASIACRYAKINTSDLTKVYQDACDVIKSFHKSNKAIPDNYSYITGTNIDSAFMWSKYDAQFRELGEHPLFKKEFITAKINSYNRYEGTIDKTVINLAKTPIIDTVNQSKILTRYHMLLTSGIIDETDYIKYLTAAKGMNEHDYKLQQNMIKDKWFTDDTSRILTEYEGIKKLGKDEDFQLTCTIRGNSEGGWYFEVGKKYTYKGSYEEECWEGEKATGRFIDAHTGAERASHLISAYAKYSEESIWWADNEHWAFSSNPGGSYFYIMFNQAAE